MRCKNFVFCLVFYIIAAFLYIPPCANANNYLNSLIIQAKRSKLYESRAWLALAYYRKNSFFKGYRSEVDNPRFFFSINGTDNPHGELIATIEAMFSPENLDDKHPQCTFPARFAWLKKQLDLDLTQVPKPDCKGLNKWKAELNAHQVSLIFATAYLNSPSSMYGHTFLRFDPLDNSESALLMAHSINFAADISEQEGIIDYIYKGLFGGFPGKYTIQPFYRKLKTYADIDSRDIWEYRLNLSTEELEMVVYHIWELNDKMFDYFFLDENCAYRIIALLEVALPDLDLTKNYTVYTMPVDTIRKLSKHGIIDSKKYRASANKRFFHRAKNLTASERQLIIDIVQDNLPHSNRLSELPEKRKALVLTLASEYLTILINKDVLDRRKSSRLTHRLLTERGKLSIPVISYDEVPEPFASPDQGHMVHRFSISSGYNEGKKKLTIGYRDNYHALFDPLAGFEDGAQVEFFNLELSGSEKTNIQIEKLTILNITSLTPTNAFFRPASWSFSFGAERKYIYFGRHLVHYLEFERGISLEIGKYLLSGMADFSMEMSNAFQDGYGLGIGFNSRLTYQGSKFSYGIGILTMKYILGDKSLLHNLWGEISFLLDNKNAIFLSVRRSLNNLSSNNEINLGLRHYF